MAIVNFTFMNDKNENRMDWVEGSYCPMYSANVGEPILVIWETFVGCCISERERNGYDDSDFYMTVWDEEKQMAYEIQFATTRYWCRPAFGSNVDATPEVVEKYEAFMARVRERKRITRRKEGIVSRHNKVKENVFLARKNEVSVNSIKKLRSVYDHETFEACAKLLKSKLRSEFRKSLKAQLISWLNGERDYPAPFSYKQLQYL